MDLVWDAPTTNADNTPLTDLASYRIYVNTSGNPCPGSFMMQVPSPKPAPSSGDVVTARVSGLTTGAIYFAQVTAVDSSGNQSDCSNEARGQATGAPGGSPIAAAGGGGGGGGCFIATAAYGSSLAPQVRLLREVRDRFLVRHPIGSAFVGFYNKVSPPMAAIIGKSETLRTLARGALVPLLWWAAVMLWSPLVGLGGPLFVLALGGWMVIRDARRSN
jgi:hypothetical protein